MDSSQLSPTVSIIIPVMNKWELTKACLESLARHTPAGVAEVIVVDNGSTDETAHALAPLGKQLFGNLFTPIRWEENRNFGPACNAGAEAARAPMLFFLNNDTLLTPNWLPPLLEAFDANPRLGAVGPLLLYENGTVQHMGVTF
uniref:glycosyltransferase family 2 protein n=1 Tax=Desulfovibrio cuneatus TaxID=159728 RepID=UPI0012EBC515